MARVRPVFAALTAAACAVLVASCGSEAQPKAAPPALHLTSLAQDLKCSEKPMVGADGVALAVGCAFQQQMYNIKTNGAPIGTKPVTVMDAEGRIDGVLTHECGEWLLGTDRDGQDVVINRSTGEVRSHGTLHAGQPISTLPPALAVPLMF